jgi:hypothetical protein
MKYAWIECPACGGVFVRFRDPDFQPADNVTPVHAEDYTDRDGAPVVEKEIACLDCGWQCEMHHIFHAANVRRGDAMPDRKEG